MIVGRDGTPEPERWHFVVHDQKAEAGFREVVVTGARKTADRTISQFAESVAASDVIPVDSLKVDTDQLTKLAMQFGTINKKPVSAMHFELRKSGPDAAPLWTVTCLDASANELGKLIISAHRGTVIMHPGFEEEPPKLEALLSTEPSPQPVASVDADEDRPKPVKKVQPKRRPATPAPTPKPPGFFKRVFGPR